MKASNRSSRSKRTSAARRTQFLATFEQSGLSVAAFARQHRLNYTTFCGWRQRQAKLPASPAFVEVEVAPAVPAAELVIELGRHAAMRIHCAGQIALAAQLLQHLNASRSC